MIINVLLLVVLADLVYHPQLCQGKEIYRSFGMA